MSKLRDKLKKNTQALGSGITPENFETSPVEFKEKKEEFTPRPTMFTGLGKAIEAQKEAKPEPVKEETALPSKEQVKERNVIKQASTKDFSKMPDFNKTLSDINKINLSLSPEDKKFFNDKLNNIKELREKAEKQYEDKKNTAEWAEVASIFADALTKLGAGMYGTKHGIDLSGIKLPKVNFSKSVDRAESDLKRKLGELSKEERLVLGERESVERDLAKEEDFLKRAMLQDHTLRFKEYQRQQSEMRRAQDRANKLEQKAESTGNKEFKKEADKIKKEQDKKIKDRIKEEERELKLFEKAGSALLGDNVKQKDIKKAMATLGMTKGSELEKASKEKGWFWDTLDADKAREYIKSVINQKKKAISGLKTSGQVPETKVELSEEDKQALEWANSNPTDPRAVEIKRRLGK